MIPFFLPITPNLRLQEHDYKTKHALEKMKLSEPNLECPEFLVSTTTKNTKIILKLQ